MFTEQIRIYGIYSKIAKKYSKDNSIEKSEPFNLVDKNGKESNTVNVYIFDTILDCLLVATMLGIIHNRKEEESMDKNNTATVFAEILIKKNKLLERIYQHMVLTRYTNLTIDERIKKAFGIISPDEEKIELENMKAYMRGGLVIIDEYFENSGTIEGFCNKIIDFINDYSIDFDEQ